MNHWKINDWLTFSGVIVALIGVLATSIFSYLLWRATQRSTDAAESSAAAAVASTELAKNLERERARTASALRSQLVHEIKQQADYMLGYLVAHQMGKINDEKMRETPKTHSVPSYYIAEYFSDQERQIINSAWSDYDDYINRFWTSDDLTIGIANRSQNDDSRVIALIEVQRKFIEIVDTLHN